MDIEEFIKKEAGSDSENDKLYSEAIRKSFAKFNGMSRGMLLSKQRSSRIAFAKIGCTQSITADCVVLYEMLRHLK